MQLFQKCHLFSTGTPKQRENYNKNRNVMSVPGSVVVSRLGMSVTTQRGSGRHYVGSGRQFVTGS